MIVHDPVSFFSCQSIIPSDDYYLTDIEIDETTIIDAINELSSTSAAGPDAIPPLLLINCAAELAPALKLLFTQSLMHGFIPTSFKSAAITPAFKSGIKTSPCNYRPISLTSQRQKCDVLCVQETHRGETAVRPRIRGMSLVNTS